MSAALAAHWREYATALSATLITAAAGTTVGWTSPTIPRLLASSSPIPTTADQSSWIASLMILGSALSPLPGAWLAERAGRKGALLLAAAPYALGWALVLRARSVAELYASRLVCGVGYGVVYTVAPMYLGEIASDKLRGSMATLITVMSKVGILTQYSIGPYVSMTALAGINLALPIAFVLTFMWFPESPYYYLKVQQFDNAERSLKVLRGKSNVKAELDAMKNLVTEDMKHKGRWRDLVLVEGNRRALVIILGVYTTQQFCGSTAVIAYAQQIFSQTGGGMGAEAACILLGSVQLITSAASSLLVDHIGRKPLLLLSSAGVAFSNLSIGSYFILRHMEHEILNKLNLIPILSMIVFICSYTIGLATVPFAITSEMFPTNIKSRATCVIQTYTAVTTFAVTKLYQVVADSLGTYVAFFGFAAFSFVGLLFIYIMLSETKGQSFKTIQNQLNIKSTILEKPIDTNDDENL